MVSGVARGCLFASVMVLGGCIAAATSHHENAFPETRRAAIGWGLVEAARNYEDAWNGEGQLHVPMETLSASYAPVPTLKLGLAMHGTGVGLTGKAVLGYTEDWAAAVVGDVGYLFGDDDDPITHTRTWEASGPFTNLSAVLSYGGRRTIGPREITFALSAGPKVVATRLSWSTLDGGSEWHGTVVDYGGFVGAMLERSFFRGSIEGSLLEVDRPQPGTRELAAFGGVKIFFSW